jgi:hypothetical protein
MGHTYPLKLIIIGFFLVLFGFIGPLLMILGIVETTFTFSFLSHIASISGLFLGTIGAAMYIRLRR